MLETRNLTKIYNPKKGVPVRALDGISLKFPDKGMVFLLGKSGSGKSTLLNVLGGLDRYDDGEILIKGVSSKEFSQQHFDSYRNTYVGFIFQEYNILEEFSVGANIALALQLQGKKPDDETVNKILREVDLEGYGNRKPNELSGGQKQRVAIARALVKSPEIIMADEPTGALDSNTGKQVLDTLKKLSAEKLVIIVSHDREFAERYADRIVELADGKVISDMERSGEVPVRTEQLQYSENEITVPGAYHLTEEDREAINRYIDSLNGKNAKIKIANVHSGNFRATDTEKIQNKTGGFHLIKSKLPLQYAFRMGASGLKYKKFRLVMTILLSCIAFGLFGLADTFGSYDHIKTCVDSIQDSQINYAAIEKAKVMKQSNINANLTESDIAKLEEATGIKLNAVWQPMIEELSVSQYLGDTPKRELELRFRGFQGFTEINEESLKNLRAVLVEGRLPDGAKNEVAISRIAARTFLNYGYCDQDGNIEEIKTEKDLIGKTFSYCNETFTVTGIVDTGLDISRYQRLETEQEGEMSAADELLYFVLQREYNAELNSSLASMLMIGEGRLAGLQEKQIKLIHTNVNLDGDNNGDDYFYEYASYVGRLSENRNLSIQWLDGKERTELGEKELVFCPGNSRSYGGGVIIIDQEQNPETETDYSEYAKRELFLRQYRWYSEDNFEDSGYRIVGIIVQDSKEESIFEGESFLLCSDSLYEKLDEGFSGTYSLAIGAMPDNTRDLEKLVSYCYTETDATVYPLANSVTYELDMVHEVLQVFSKVFLYIGLGFAVFAALLLSNFIATSISHKKQEIGILRAIGSRGNDVFRIFFAESFLIAMINFVLSTIGVIAATALINHVIRSETGILLTILHFGPRQAALLFALSLLIAAVASFLPVKKIASKRPIDAIRNR